MSTGDPICTNCGSMIPHDMIRCGKHNQEKYKMNTTKPSKKPAQPEILYEETKSGEASLFPFVEIAAEEKMPVSLFIFEYKHMGTFEPGPNGEEVPNVDQIPHQFVDLNVLKEKLSPSLFDEVRVSIGMLPLKEAAQRGKEKLDKILANVDKIKQDLLSKREQDKKEKK
jgi:hypothetical protein